MTVSQLLTRSRTYPVGFFSLDREQQPTQLPLQGQLPEWLTGSLLRTGPAKYEVGTQSYRHWFDGLAMLYRFSFGNGVSYNSKFLSSKAYQEAMATGKITRTEFGTNPDYSLLEWLASFFKERQTDNGVVNISYFNNQYVALTESPFPIIFDPKTLQTIDRFQYKDDVQGQITIAHPHFDFQRRELISYITQLSLKSIYHVYRMSANSNQRQLIASIPVQEAAYMHTFGLTENFVILVEFPLFFNLLSMAAGTKTPAESLEWKPERGTRFVIINRHDGSVVTAHDDQAFFTFHHVNAFEQGNEILLDMPVYPDKSLIDGFYLSELRNATDRVITGGELRRYRIPLNGSSVTHEVISDVPIELPRINYRRCNGQPYQFAYGNSNQQPHNFNDSLVKIDVQQGTSKIWQEAGCYPGEPVFAAAPHTGAEDEGVLLSVVADTQKPSSFLLVLDAQSFTEIARAEIPHLIPFHFHGQYFENQFHH
jgi:beta,beta-carotene 9',10'-dioxygenase